MNSMNKGYLKGCLLSLVALAISFFLVFVPLQGIFNYMGWPVFNGGGLHAGTWIIAWPVLFFPVYGVLLLTDRSWHRKSK
jgi:hypothetical protein